MFKYIGRRLGQSIIVMLGVSLLAFSVLFLSGDPTYLYVNERASAEQIQEMRHQLGFDKPIYVQYWDFISNAARGDFGKSLRYGQPAMEIVLERFPATVELTMVGMFVALVFAIPLGILAASKRNSILDGGTMVLAMVGQSIPGYWFGLMLILIVGVHWRLLPISGRVPLLEPLLHGDFGLFFSSLGDGIRHLILPGVASGIWSLSRNTRLVRSSMLEVLGVDYITTARSKGVPERKVVMKHAFRNAMIPVVTIVGLEVGFLLSGNIVIENVFAWPGIGRLIIFAINQKDFNVVQAGVITLAFFFVMLNLLVDILYTWLDPRIRYN